MREKKGEGRKKKVFIPLVVVLIGHPDFSDWSVIVSSRDFILITLLDCEAPKTQ